MASSSILALMLAYPQIQATPVQEPALPISLVDVAAPANYHLDRSNQEAFQSRLTGEIGLAEGSVWTGRPVTVVFPCPLGFSPAKYPGVRDYPDQRIRDVKIYRGETELPFVPIPKQGEFNYWTFNTEGRRGADCIAIRLSPPEGTEKINLTVDVSGTLIHPVVRPGSPAQNAYQFELPIEVKSAYLSPIEDEYKADLPKLLEQLAGYEIIDRRPVKVGEMLNRIGMFFVKNSLYDKDVDEPTLDMNQFFDPNYQRIGNCHALNTPLLFAARAVGIPASKVSGRFLETGKAHTVCRIYDPQLRDSFLVDVAAVAAYGITPNRSGLELISDSMPQRLLLFEDDASNFFRPRIEGLENEPSPGSGARGATNCGDWVIFSGGSYIGSVHPTISEKLVIQPLTDKDGQFVVFTKEGIFFRIDRPNGK